MAERAALEVRDLVAGWDSAPVVRGADLEVAAGELVAILGGNGSGKSSLLWAIAGLLRPWSGSVSVDGRDVGRWSPERRAAAGLRLLAQTRRVFPSLTVEENLELVDVAVGRPDRRRLQEQRDAWLERFPGLAAKVGRPAAVLSGGEQQLVAIGRVVITEPRVLLLDEPSAGLAGAAAKQCCDLFVELAARGVAIVLVEQDVALARRLASRVLHLRDGRLVP